jgi:hypothetical protein
MARTRTSATTHSINATSNPTQTLNGFGLAELAPFTFERRYAKNAREESLQLYAGHDDVSGVLKFVLSRVRVSLYINMFGYDDDELNEILMRKALDPDVAVLITLDRSQAGGKHEKLLLDIDRQKNLAVFNTHFVLGLSSTHRISTTRGFVADGVVGCEGSINWSARSGEGTFSVVGNQPRSAHKEPDDLYTIFTNADAIARFQTELIAEHMNAQNQIYRAPVRRKEPGR